MMQLFLIIAGFVGAPIALLLAFLTAAAMPLLFVWVVWHFMYQTRRIADALEVLAYGTQNQARPTLAATHEEISDARGRILNSAFGR